MTDDAIDDPIEGQILLLASAKASVTASDLPPLVRRVQAYLIEHALEYERGFERIHAEGRDRYYLVPGDHWTRIGTAVGLDDAERDAVRRAHEQQLLRRGRELDRREEFESALEIRDAVVIRVPE
jgi:hypothetical protein